jgi:hypothetical protein
MRPAHAIVSMLLGLLGFAATSALVRVAWGQPAEGPHTQDEAGAPTTDAGADAGHPAAAAEGKEVKEAKGLTKEGNGGKGEADAGKDEDKPFEVEGYVNLGVGARSVPGALPRDQISYGLRSSVAGLIFKGTPFEHFSYVVHFGVSPETISLVSGVELADKNGDGSQQDVVTKTQDVTSIPIEEVSIQYAITDWWKIKGGHFYMPFSPGASVIITSQMFPTRPEPTRVFMIGADQGIATTTTFLDERLLLSAGVFNGSSLELQVPGTTALGPVYSAVIDVQPLGKMPDMEGDPKRGPFRFGLGTGMIYRTGKLYDETGYEATAFREVRFDAAARIAFAGLFLQGEYLRRQQKDDLSSRPATATGAYVQGSFFLPLPGTRLALAPLGRYGLSIQDQDFVPTKTIELEAGLAFFPRADIDDPNKLRIIVQYEGERRLPEDEAAHGGVVHVQLRW